MKLEQDSNNNYKIGLVLAGAVSAGAFTGGSIDYLLNTLELWNQQYKNSPDETPRPNVKIETITGASAGSIAAAITILSSVTNRFKSISPNDVTNNKLNLQYYTWVDYGLENEESIIHKIFSTNDLKTGELKSMLNTEFIEDLITKIKTIFNDSDISPLPSYFDEDIEILLTLSNLRGVPVNLYFSNESDNIAHSMSYHKAFAHFKLNKNDSDNSTLRLDLKSETDLNLFLDCAKASGAFPIGLKSVKFANIPKEYIKTNLNLIFGKEVSIKPQVDENYSFLAVDGGMTNNEPIAEALRILDKDRSNNIPIIMIDPFPNYINSEKNNETEYDLDKDSLWDIIPQLFSTLRNQVLFKESDIPKLFSKDSIYKMIWPTRYDKNNEALDNPIATGALGGFSGFFSREFRHHDYFLGQKNCQNFLRYYFSQSIKDATKTGWTNPQIEKFKFIDENGDEKVPIIPDFRIHGRDGKSFLPKIEDDINFPKYPQIDQNELVIVKLKPLIKKRLNEIIKIILGRKKEKSQQINHSFQSQVSISKFGIGMIIPKCLKNWIIKRQVVKTLLPVILDIITDSLADYDLFKNNLSRRDTRLNKSGNDIKEV